ncbi:MAG: hypothetical protein HYX37_14315 [Rhizobiales bacterium]|nr:hypothetical protein [Hyphomicrobiales bacterium]
MASVAEARNLQDPAAKIAKYRAPVLRDFGRALHDDRRWSAAMLDQRMREMPAFVDIGRIVIDDEREDGAIRRH